MLRSSRIFCQCGKRELRKRRLRVVIGSPKKANPNPKVAPFVKRYEVVKSEIRRMGIMRVARRSR